MPIQKVSCVLSSLSLFKKKVKYDKGFDLLNCDVMGNWTYFSILKKNVIIRLNVNKKKKSIFFSTKVLIYKYKYYTYFNINKITTRSNEIKNIVKIHFTRSNVFPSILVEKFENDLDALRKYLLVFTISIGTFNKLTKFTGWKKKNTNFIIMLSNFIYNILFNSSYITHTLYVKNIKKSFFAMLPVLQKINFKYLIIKDRSFFSKIKTKKKTNIKRRLSRKMTYVCPIKM